MDDRRRRQAARAAGRRRGRACRRSPRPIDRATSSTAIYERWLDADVFAPDGAGSPRRPGRSRRSSIIQPPPNVTGSLHLGPRPALDGRGPDDPPRPDAAAARRCSCRASTTRRSPPSSSSTSILAAEGESRASRSAASATSSGCGEFVERTREVIARPAASSRRLARLEPAAVHDGRRLGPRRAGGLPAACTRGAGLPDRGAHQLVPGLPDERVATSRSIPTPETGTLWSIRYHLDRRGDRRSPIPTATDQRRHDPPGDDPRRHRRRRPSRRPSLLGPRRAPGP